MISIMHTGIIHDPLVQEVTAVDKRTGKQVSFLVDFERVGREAIRAKALRLLRKKLREVN